MNKKNLKQLLSFLVYLVAFLLVMDKILFFALNVSSDKVQSGYLIGKLNRYLAVKDTTDILIYGSSRTNHHVDAGMMPASAFNIGLDGVRLGYVTPLVKLLPHDREQLVLVHMDSYVPNFEAEDLDRLFTKYHREKAIRDAIRSANAQHPLQDVFWTLDYNGTVAGIARHLIAPPLDTDTYSGFDPEVITGEQREVINRIMRADTIPEPDTSANAVHPAMIRYITEIREFCDTYNKRLIVFTSPKYRYTKKRMDYALTRYLEEEGITYLDFTHFFGPDVPLEWWRDKTHLTEESARIFTAKLIEEISKLENGFPKSDL